MKDKTNCLKAALFYTVALGTGAFCSLATYSTFSDANWITMGGVPGANSTVLAALSDGSGNLYIGGGFTLLGNVIANGIAQWNGSIWSTLGSGVLGGTVYALAVSGSNVYAGGNFSNAGGVTVNYIAKWNGNRWSALGSGLNGEVTALAVSGSDLYAGGAFTTAGGKTAWHGCQMERE
jgi:hypothetical protein